MEIFMKTLITILIALFCITNANAQINWTKIESGTTVILNDVCFPEDISKGYIVGEKSNVLRTQNNGESWESLNINGSTNISFKTISSPVNFQNAMIIGLSGDAILFQTSTNGQIWNKAFSGNFTGYTGYGYLIGYFPINLSQGYCYFTCGGWDQGVVKTIDGGNSWNKILSPSGNMTNLLFRNNNSGIIIGSNGLIYRTSNAGSSWDGPIFSNKKSNLNGLCFLDKNSNSDWIIVGDAGTILKTTDGGTNWRIIPTGVESNLKAVKFSTNQKVGVAIGEEGKILTTYDKGETWSVYTYPSAENLNAISIPPSQDKVAYIVGSNGLILKSVNITDVEDNSTFNKIDFNISPNPASDNIYIYFTNSEFSNSSISVFNSLGIEIKRIDENELIGKSSINISTADFPVGMYYCTLNTGKEKITKSFVVLK